MSFRNKVKKNIPKVALDSIMSLIVGSYKVGKTRLWKEVTEKHYSNPEEALLIAFEPGYETWELESLIPVHEEATSEEDVWKVWEYFKKEVVKGLVQEAKEGRKVKLIGIDTADRCIDAATSWLVKDRSRKYGKQLSSVQEISTASNGDENGWTALYEEMKKPFDALRTAGYGVMALAWTKEKETTLYNGMKYNSVELMMNNTGRKVFESQASFICCLFNEVVVLDAEGNELEENLKTKKGKEVGSNFHRTQVVMHFRPSEYVSIAGGRYIDLPEEQVPYCADNFLEVFENAVKGQLKKTNKSVEQLHQEEEFQKDAKVKEESAKEESLKLAQTIKKKMATELEKWTNQEKVSTLVPKFTELLGDPNYNNSTDPVALQKCYDFMIENKK